MTGSPTVHCELAPVLINRTAVYRMCRQIGPELTKRGLRVRTFALLSKLNSTCQPNGWWSRCTWRFSARLLHWALRRPRTFLAARPVLERLCKSQRRGAFPLVMDPLYLLFHGELAHGVVMVYDTTPLTHPEWHGAATSRLYSAALKMLARSSCHVVTCSKHTSDELRVNHAIVPSRLTVLPLGPLTSTCNQSHGAESRPANEAPFLLFVGNIEPRKNVAGLVRAFNKADLFRTCGVRLRIIGTICDPKDRAVIEAHSTAGVDVLGFVDDATLAASYRDCLGFIYPSFCEGFGIPLLEAMSAGCVCLATSAGASPEVGGDAVLYVNPHDDDAIAAGMLRVLNMCDADRRALRERSKQRAQTFTWERFYDGLSGVLIKEAERCFAGSGVSYCGAAV